MVKKIKQLFRKIYHAISKDILATIEEFRAILRNRKFLMRYPKLFAIFAIIEHEQNPHLFELQSENFDKIKSEILHDKNENNHQILEVLRGLFQNVAILSAQNLLRDKIIRYLTSEISRLINDNNRYYAPLTKAVLRGFPFLLSHNDYAVFKLILQRKSRNSLKLLKYILDGENFPNFFIKQECATLMLLVAHDIDNKPAFMFLLRYLRQQDLLNILFYEKSHHIRAKIINATSIKKRGADYASVLLSYFKNRWLTVNENKQELEKLLRAVFIAKNVLDIKQKTKSYYEMAAAIKVSRSFGCENFAVEKMLDKITELNIAKKNIQNLPVLARVGAEKSDDILQGKPSSQIVPRSFFAMAPLAAEEVWLARVAPYLL